MWQPLGNQGLCRFIAHHHICTNGLYTPSSDTFRRVRTATFRTGNDILDLVGELQGA
jgi:hypothetical protein